MPLCMAIKVSLINMSSASPRGVGPRANQGNRKMGGAKLTTPAQVVGNMISQPFLKHVHLHLSCFVKVGAKILIYCHCFV